MPYAPSPHTSEETETWVRESLIPNDTVTLAAADGTVVGVLACSEAQPYSFITQMAVRPSLVNRGVGSRLLAHAMQTLCVPIRLYTFQENHGARRFYERHGFRAVQFTEDQATEEHCPDVLYEFP